MPSDIIAPDDPGPDDLAEMMEARVLKVFDGDGFLADIRHPDLADFRWIKGRAFRFAFIDAPEMEQALGPEAKEFLHRAIVGKTLRLEAIGKESMGYLPVDSYRRMLCMGYLTEEMPVGDVAYWLNGKCGVGSVNRARPVTRNVELEMVINGWAWVTPQYSFEREADYFAAQEDAKQNRRGLWATDNPEPPWTFKQKLKRQRAKVERSPTLPGIDAIKSSKSADL